MTSGNELTSPAARQAVADRPAATRRSLKASAAPRWSRRRGVLGVFAGLAVVGFAAAYIGPMGGALSSAVAEDDSRISLYADSADDAQALDVPAADTPAAVAFERSGYTVYVTPKPTPTPEPKPAARSSSSSSSAAAAPLFYTGGGSAAEWMAAAGIAESDWGYVDYIVGRESGWNPNATNRSSGACGLVQALPCSKVPGNGYDPVDNLRWGNGYAVGRYGSWAAAYNFWTSNHWW
ncbi:MULTISPECIES: lytic transglycosylase domain-containing protein [unclassified Microbacterium]|uniref:lytic transglycosylase domain-containing protein n=1 Tax=unclassified Microbacterium TaxID=2609290 RepID=UPI00214B5494|nr:MULTISPECIES: lytic transglycosylase domain-containing protein [unclassified Microbacterium]MCR2785452.1 lytic transglycosylase domain-containing protein [Microbacterium sp. zg.B96]WIM14522.1 lytic transglycosylase domain-containing protein [Microbacterium sp. zg-B96]